MSNYKFFGNLCLAGFIIMILYAISLIFQGNPMEKTTPYILGSIGLICLGFLLKSKKK